MRHVTSSASSVNENNSTIAQRRAHPFGSIALLTALLAVSASPLLGCEQVVDEEGNPADLSDNNVSETADDLSLVVSNPRVLGFRLVDTSKANAAVNVTAQGATVEVKPNAKYTIEALATESGKPAAGSIEFLVNNKAVIVENNAPYVLGGNSGSTFAAYADFGKIGTYVVRMIPYASANKTGAKGAELSVTVKVVSATGSNTQSGDLPTPPSLPADPVPAPSSGGSAAGAWSHKGPGLLWAIDLKPTDSSSLLSSGLRQPDGSSWSFQLQLKDPSRLRVFSAQDRPGFVGLSYMVKPGDLWGKAGDPNAVGIRAEISGSKKNGTKFLEGEGDDYWWAWSTRFPQNFVVEGDWTIFTQWHDTGCDCLKPPLAFDLAQQGGQTQMRVLTRGGSPNYRSSTKWILDDSLDKNKWYDIVAHVVSSASPSKGLLQVWVNGQKKVSANTNVLYSGEKNYFKQGLYKGSMQDARNDVSVEHAMTRVGTQCESVAPASICSQK